MSNFGKLLKEFMAISNALKAENQLLFLSDIAALREELIKCQAAAIKREKEKESTAISSPLHQSGDENGNESGESGESDKSVTSVALHSHSSLPFSPLLAQVFGYRTSFKTMNTIYLPLSSSLPHA